MAEKRASQAAEPKKKKAKPEMACEDLGEGHRDWLVVIDQDPDRAPIVYCIYKHNVPKTIWESIVTGAYNGCVFGESPELFDPEEIEGQTEEQAEAVNRWFNKNVLCEWSDDDTPPGVVDTVYTGFDANLSSLTLYLKLSKQVDVSPPANSLATVESPIKGI